MKLGEFALKCKEASYYLQSTEPCSPWSNSAEREIRELKKGATRKLTQSGAPRRLWCFALEYEAYVRSHTAHDIYLSMAGSPRPWSLGKQHTLALSELARVLRCKHDPDGNLVGTAHANPALDTRVYEVCFPDGRTEELAANVIAEAVYAQCDADSNQYVLLDAIVDYCKYPSVVVSRNDQVTVIDGKKIVKCSIKGWELCCEWKDGSTSWQKLTDLNESHPLQVAEFAFAAQIANEPEFNWWVNWVLKKRDRVISLVKRRSARHHKRTLHKYGIELPKTVEEAYAINHATGTTFWCDAIEKEMKNVCVAFDVLADGVAPPAVHQYIRCHMIFDVKMEDFRHKDRLIAGGHVTKDPATLTYASVMSRETVRIALLIAALNDIDIWAADVLSAYITAPCKEENWTTLGKEFGDDCGRKAIVVRALYGLKSSSAAFRAHLAGCMREMGYVSCPDDPDLWLKEQTDRKGRKY
eukprot:CCRYP_000810-RA/>CCRYP_000810-RA protein AED:0.27 eAED:0.27 QI:0/0/0/1/1/1/2/0/468